MNTATKPLDRRKPFRRVDNKAFIPIRALDGDGAANGCRIDKDLGNIDEKLEAFLADTRDSVLGKTVGQVIDIVRLALNPNKLADLLLAVIKKEAGDVAFALAFPLVKALGAAAAVPLLPIRAIVEGIITPIETALRVFLISIARPIMIRANRLLPQWVPVEVGLSSNSVDRRQIIEIEGLCTRSFGNPVDAPLVNWHTWFSWNVEVQPEPEYAKALSPVSDPPNTSGMTGTERSIIKPGTFEIQWDAGALLSAGEQAIYNTKIADKDMPKADGPMVIAAAQGNKIENGGTELDTAFVWPMPGMFVWASGRHVYDCSRVTHKAGADPKKADVEATPPKMCAMINPARAMATARWQAFQFRENGTFFVPAIEFMFIASRRGGYIQHDTMADEDYVFIIDLPPGPSPASPYPIANTDNVPHNTLVVRPRLLKSLRFLERIGGKAVNPIIEILPPADGAKPPQQVRLTIPKGILDGADAYGFKLSLGWHDPSLELAKTVMLCEVDVKSLQMRLTDRDNPAQKLRKIFAEQEGDLKKTIFKELEKVEVTLPLINVKVFPLKGDGPVAVFARKVASDALEAFIDLLVGLLPTEKSEEWLFRIGVNGVWVAFFFEPVTVGPSRTKNPPRDFNANELTFKFALAKGDELMFASHGTEFDPVGDIMRQGINDRTLRFESGQRALWSSIVDPPSKKERDRLLFEYMKKMMFGTTDGVSKLSLGFDNSPLGLIDPDIVGNRGPSQQNNPTVVKDEFGLTVRAQRLAHFARAIAPEMILVEDTAVAPVTLFPVKPDYDLRYELTVTEQIKPTNA